MRLLVVSQYFWPENFRVNDMVADFVRRGHEVTVLTGCPNYPEGKVFEEFRHSPKNYSNYYGADILRVPMLARGSSKIRLVLNYLSYAFFASWVGATRLYKKQFDAIFVFEVSPVTVGFPALVVSWLKRIPIVFWVLDQWPETLAAVGVIKSPFLLNLIGRMVSFIYRRCAVVLASSKGMMPQIRKYSGRIARVGYFPNWVESVYENADASPAPEVSVVDGVFNLMFTGNIGEAQNFPAILDAAEKLKSAANIRWLIVGEGRMDQWVRDEVVRRGLQQQFILLGRFPLKRMPSFYLHADALLLSLKPDPIFSMTLPGKVQSYLTAGLPIIGMVDGEGALVIEEAQVGLSCRAGDSEMLAKIVLKMSELPEDVRKKMGENGKEYSMQKFNRDRLMQELETCLLELSPTIKA